MPTKYKRATAKPGSIFYIEGPTDTLGDTWVYHAAANQHYIMEVVRTKVRCGIPGYDQENKVVLAFTSGKEATKFMKQATSKPSKEKKITVAISDLEKVCKECCQVKEDTRPRTYYAKNYQGPCGDSFCYASCEMSACRPETANICGTCEKKLSK